MSRNGKIGPSQCGHELHLYQHVALQGQVRGKDECKRVVCPNCGYRLFVVNSTPQELIP